MSLLIRNQSILHNNATAAPAAPAVTVGRRDTDAECINDNTHAHTYTRTDLLFVQNLHGVKGLGSFVLN